MTELLGVAAAAVALAALLPLAVPLPRGGHVSAGVVVALIAVALLDPAGAAAAIVTGFAASVVVRALRRTGWRHDLEQRGLELVGALAGSAVAAEAPVVAVAVGTAGVVVARAIGVTVLRRRAMAHPRDALLIDLTIGCTAALFVETWTTVGGTVAVIAFLPLLLVRFAFQRHAAATATLAETVQALGLVPELAGVVPLGHSERTARYAEALAQAAGCSPAEVDEIVAAARLHHLGAVAVDFVDPAEPGVRVPEIGARVLVQAGFPTGVAAVVGATGAGADNGVAAAIVDAASTFDDAVGDDPASWERGLSLVAAGSRGTSAHRATAALLNVLTEQPDLVHDVVASGDRFRGAAQGVDLESLVGAGAGDLLPLVRRQRSSTVTSPGGARA